MALGLKSSYRNFDLYFSHYVQALSTLPDRNLVDYRNYNLLSMLGVACILPGTLLRI